MQQTHKNVAIRAAEEAGKIVNKLYRGAFSVNTKRNHRDLVTTADLASEKKIIEIIRTYFPHDPILSEESEHCDIHHEKKFWVIDPIDGTSNFAAGLPLSCIAIAYVQDSTVQAGVVFNHATGDMFSAQRGHGAYYNQKVPLTVASTASLHDAMVSYDYSSLPETRQEVFQVTAPLLHKVRGIRVIGATALEVSWIAAGYMDAYISRGTHPWDIAAAACILEEAGGKITDWSGNPWTMDCANYIVTNGLIHEELLKAAFQV